MSCCIKIDIPGREVFCTTTLLRQAKAMLLQKYGIAHSAIEIENPQHCLNQIVPGFNCSRSEVHSPRSDSHEDFCCPHD